MSLVTAFKAFWKALKNPKAADNFLQPAVEKPKEIEQQDCAHLRLLQQLQATGRLIDFLKEDISAYSDAQVGAAVRKVHADCAKNLEELVAIRSIYDELEGTKITIPQGYDTTKVKVIGKVIGEPPYHGVLVHKGWKAQKKSLPRSMEKTSEVICPAEIEVK